MTDAAALDRLEYLVQWQRPAQTPWAPVTDYSSAARDTVEAPHADRILAAFGADRLYLDIGCGPGHLVRLLEARGACVMGADKHPTGDAIAHDITEAPLRPQADVVICREVLEHLTIRELAQAVRHLCASSRRFVYVTTRFAKDPDHLLDVDTSDDLDPTHITLLNQDFLRVLFVLEGFTRRPDLETTLDWQQKGRVLVYERA